MKRFLLLPLLAAFGLLSPPVRAQFPSTPTQTFYVCNAPGEQKAVRAFADGAGGSHVFWIDERGGTAVGTAIYWQQVGTTGQLRWPANGKLLMQARGKKILALQAVAWQGGTLVAWIQGQSSGDSLFCQAYDAAGAPRWAQPTLVAASGTRSIIYVTPTGLNVLPNDSGATITHSLIQTGGATIFSHNRVNFTGRRRWPLNNFFASLNNTTYFSTISDRGNGFFVVGSSGGLGANLVAQRYRLQGQAAWPAPVNVSANGAGGRGEAGWPLRVLPDTSLVVTWGRYTPKDIVAVKLTPNGTYAWASPTYRVVCDQASSQDDPSILLQDNDLWVIWNDNRPPARNTHQYVQKINLATGNRYWSAGGVPVFQLRNYISNPKIVAADNGAVMAFSLLNQPDGFRAQKIRPDSTMAWPINGVPVNTTTNDRPFYADFVPVRQPDGSVQVFWTSFGNAAICGAKVYPSGALAPLGLPESATADDFTLWPNPATETVQLQVAGRAAGATVQVLDACGRVVYTAAEAESIRVAGWAAGVYVVRTTGSDGRALTRRLVVNSAR